MSRELVIDGWTVTVAAIVGFCLGCSVGAALVKVEGR